MKYPNRVIKEGEENPTIVKAIQKRLNDLGFGPFEVSGNFGPKTTSAIKLFQGTHRDQNGNPLEIDGKLGSISWNVFFDEVEVPVQQDAPNTLLTEVVRIAKSQVGIMEKPPGSNRGPEVDKYLDCAGCPPGLFWCAGFVYWCVNEAAKNLGRSNPAFKTGGCLAHWNNTKGKKITTAEAVNKPSLIKPGHIFIMDHGKGMGHTGIITKVEGGFLTTIEGNSNTGGSRNGIGVFELQRKIGKISKGFIEYK